MGNRITVFMLLTIALLLNLNLKLTAQNQPKAWYVYKNANGLNNGTSWTNAWTSFSNINWNAIADEDTLYISGGSDTLYYLERFDILKSNIVISGSHHINHNGVVVIKGEGIFINGKSNVKISNISLLSNVSQGIRVEYSNDITIENIKILTDARGIFIQRSTDVTIRYCNITTVSFSEKQTDGIYSQRNRRIKIHNNYIEIRNSEPNGHNDCIQSFEDGVSQANALENTLMVWNNILFQNNNKLNNSSATMMTYGWGWFTFYNNLILQPYSYTVGLGVQQNIQSELSNMKCRIWNNTLIAGTFHDKPIFFNRMKNIDTVDVVNNVIYNSSQYQKARIDDSQNMEIIRWNANAYYSTHPNWNKLVIKDGILFTIEQWINLGKDVNSIFSDPYFIDPYIGLDSIGKFSPNINSPLLDAGVNISQEVLQLGLPWEDISGNLRYDNPSIGAFEYLNNQGIIDNTPPELVSAEIIDSITVNVTFSETMEQSSVTNPVNYSIDNGIVVNSVQLLSAQTVRLNTSVHSPGFYTVTVNNVADTAGNIISSQYNSFIYGYNPNPLLELKLIPNNSLASAISDTLYVPQKTFDGLTYSSGDPTSRWAALGLPQWIVYDLGDAKILNKTRIQYYNWNQGRIYNYSVQVSTDSVNWTYVKQNVSSTNTEWTEEVFEPTPARYVKIIVHSNNQNNWASLWEAEFYGNLIISGNDDLTNVPKEFKLEQNYPNPFNPTTKIKYSIPRSTEYYSVQQKVTLKVYDILGNEIATLVDDYKSAGNYEVDFNASDIASGVYIYRLFVQDLQTKDGKNGVYTESKKMLLMR